MNILFLDAYYEPEKYAFSHIENDIIGDLIDHGHKVTVICPIPTRGITEQVRNKYQTLKIENLFAGCLHVERFHLMKEYKNTVLRTIRYFCAFFKTYFIARKYSNIDVVFSNSTPPIQGLLANMVRNAIQKKRKRKVDFVFSLQDCFPESLVYSGLAGQNGILFKIGTYISKITYEKTDRIITISELFKNNVLKYINNGKKIYIVPNWIDTTKVTAVEKSSNFLFEKLSLPRDKFIILYAGNFGLSQGISNILELIDYFKNNDDLLFVFFGNGSEYDGFKSRVQRDKFDNIRIFELLPEEYVSYVYSLGDLNIISCKKGFGNCGIPSKTWAIMGVSKPIIAFYDAESELSNLINKYKLGFVGKPLDETGSIDTNIKLVEKCLSDTNLKRFGENGFTYVNKHNSKVNNVQKYRSVIENVL